MKNIVKDYTCKIENELRGVYELGPKLLVEPINHVFSGKGKRIRPLLTLFTSKTLGYDVEKALDAAISIEILHNFTLVHDDIMDKDKLISNVRNWISIDDEIKQLQKLTKVKRKEKRNYL